MFSIIWTAATWIVAAVITLSLVSVGFGMLYLIVGGIVAGLKSDPHAAPAAPVRPEPTVQQWWASDSIWTAKMPSWLYHVLYVVLAVGIFALSQAAHAAELESVQVCRVIDGDTVVTCAGEHLRLKGICTAELREPGGRAARQALIDLLDFARSVEVERFTEREKYGRTLARLWIDGVLLEQDQLGPVAGRGLRYCKPGRSI